jgi:hypothetical protein
VFSFIESETACDVTTSVIEGTGKLKAEPLNMILERRKFPFPDFLNLDV